MSWRHVCILLNWVKPWSSNWNPTSFMYGARIMDLDFLGIRVLWCWFCFLCRFMAALCSSSLVEKIELFDGSDDAYGGVVVEMKEPMDSELFASVLRASLLQWTQQVLNSLLKSFGYIIQLLPLLQFVKIGNITFYQNKVGIISRFLSNYLLNFLKCIGGCMHQFFISIRSNICLSWRRGRDKHI